jgi:murein L,D-transpeptidase YcbB/YkuD
VTRGNRGGAMPRVMLGVLVGLSLGHEGGRRRPPEALDPAFWIDVNLPAFRLTAYDGIRVVATYAVAPGAPAYRTPRGRFAISRIEWNPWWIPPDRPWARKERPTPPGPSNPMGSVKLYFRPLYFLHGTPYEGSIGAAASHGCVRMRNADAVALAALVLRHVGSPFDDDSVRAVLATDRTRTIELAETVPVQVRYELIELRGDSVWAYPDVYHLGAATPAQVREIVARAGRDAGSLDDARVRALLAKARRAATWAPVDSLH